MQASWREIPHTADLGIEVTAPDRAALFETAARGMIACIGDLSPAAGAAAETVRVLLAAADEAALLRDWLAEVLFRVDQRRMTLAAVNFAALDAGRLDAEITLVPYDPARSVLRREVKAVTYHQLSVTRTASGFTARVLFDI